MRTPRFMAVAMLIVGSGLALGVMTQTAQQSGIKRTDLVRHDLDVPGREVIQVRVDFAPAGVSARGRASR